MASAQRKITALINAETGMVSSQAQPMFSAIRHRTAESLRREPTPAIAPAIVCVVLTGMPPCVARNRVAAPAVSAANPPTGLRRVMRCPIVRTIRQPPERVPNPMAAWQASTTQSGMLVAA